MKKNVIRETLSLSLFIFVIGGVAFWKSQQPVVPEELPPHDAGWGPLRLEFGEWKDVPVSAGEVATGHDFKKVGRVYLVGQEALAWRQNSFYDLNANAFAVEFRRGQKWHSVKRQGGWNGIRETKISEGDPKKQKVQSQKFSLALPFAPVPRNADEVRLRGKMTLGLIKYLGRGKFQDKTVASPEVYFSLWKKSAKWPEPQVERKAVLTASNPEVHLLGEAVKEPVLDGSPFLSTADVQVKLDSHWVPPRWKKESNPFLIMPQDVQLLDAKGHDWASWQPNELFADAALGICTLGRNPKINVRLDDPTIGEKDYHMSVSTRYIPRSAGVIRLKARVSLYDQRDGSSDWPLTLETVVRPLWMTKTPRNLQLLSVGLTQRKFPVDSVVKNGEYVDVFQNTPCIEAILCYSGAKPLIVRGEVDSTNHEYGPDQMEYPSIIARIPFGDRSYGFYLGAKLLEAHSGEDELISSWSQRVENRDGSLSALFYNSIDQSQALDIETRKPALETTGNKTRVTVRYFLPGYKPQKAPLVFKAEIGLRNQGFVEIEKDLPALQLSKSVGQTSPNRRR